jgi:acetyl esterase
LELNAQGNEADRSRLRPELRAMLEEAERSEAIPITKMDAKDARLAAELDIANLWGIKDDVDATEDFTIHSRNAEIKARLYRAATANTILFFHGGGWVLGSIETHDGAVRALVTAAKANVLSIEYRKAPEHVFPAAIEDAEAALDWLVSNASVKGLAGTRLIVAGDSAGANIAAVLAIKARDRNLPLLGQALIYPATDLANRAPSHWQFSQGFFLDSATMDWYASHYLSENTDRAHPDVSPMFAQSLEGLAAAYVATADHDPLRDEGRAYAQRLIAAGNDVCYEEWRGTVHGFFNMDRNTPAARQIIARIGEWANSVWSR